MQRESAAPGSGASPNSKHAMEVIGSRVKCMFEVGTGRTGGKQWFAGTAVRPTSKGWAVVKFDDGDTKTMLLTEALEGKTWRRVVNQGTGSHNATVHSSSTLAPAASAAADTTSSGDGGGQKRKAAVRHGSGSAQKRQAQQQLKAPLASRRNRSASGGRTSQAPRYVWRATRAAPCHATPCHESRV